MKTADMTKGSPAKLLLQFAIPILIENLFQQAYKLADRIIVGRFVGDTAFSAIGATNALSMMFMSMCMVRQWLLIRDRISEQVSRREFRTV